MSRSKQKPLLEKLLITEVAAEGKAIARLEGQVVFVSDCIPGDVVDVQVQGLPVEAPVVRMLVVRSDASGFGLRYAG